MEMEWDLTRALILYMLPASRAKQHGRSDRAIGRCVRHGPGLLICCGMHVSGARCIIASKAV